MPSGTWLGGAYYTVGADDSALDKTLLASRKKLSELGSFMRKLGAQIAAVSTAIEVPLTLATKKFASMAKTIGMMAERTGLAAREASELGFVAERAGASMERLETAVSAMQKGLFDAKSGKGSMKEALDELGLSWESFENLSSGEKLTLLADRIAGIKDPSRRAAIAMKAFGDAGRKMLPFLNLGAEGIAHYRKEAKRLGLSMDEDMVKRGEAAAKAFSRLSDALKGLTAAVGDMFSAGVTQKMLWLTNLVVGVREYLRAHPQVIEALSKLTAVLTGLGLALITMGLASTGLSKLVSPAGLLVALAATLAYISGILDPLIDKWGKMVLEFEIGGQSISKWIGHLVKIWGTFSKALADMWGDVVPVFRKGWEVLKTTFKGFWESFYTGFLVVAKKITLTLAGIFAKIGGKLDAQANAEDSGIVESRVLRGMGSAFGGIGTTLIGAKQKIGDQLAARKGKSAAAELAQGKAWKDFTNSLAGAGTSIKGRGLAALGDIGKSLKDALAPTLDKIFGEKRPEGGAKTIDDIFTGLGAKFAEFQGKAIGFSPLAGEAKSMVAGTFSGRAASLMQDAPMMRLNKERNDLLDDIKTALDKAAANPAIAGGVGGGDW